ITFGALSVKIEAIFIDREAAHSLKAGNIDSGGSRWIANDFATPENNAAVCHPVVFLIFYAYFIGRYITRFPRDIFHKAQIGPAHLRKLGNDFLIPPITFTVRHNTVIIVIVEPYGLYSRRQKCVSQQDECNCDYLTLHFVASLRGAGINSPSSVIFPSRYPVL